MRYTSNTVRMTLPAFRRTLRSISSDGRVLIFDSSDPQITSLSEGEILFIEHLGVRRIVGVSKQGAQFAVGTESAGLTDFIQDGRIEFSAPFTSSAIPAGAQSAIQHDPLSSIWAWFSPQAVYAQGQGICDIGESGLQLSGTVDNWQFKVGGRFEDQGNVRFCASLVKKLASLDAGIRMRGNIDGARAAFRAIVRQTQLLALGISSPFNGTADINWAVQTTSPGAAIGEARFKSPPFLKDVIEIGPLPFLLQVNANVIFRPGFGGKQDAGSGSLQAHFSGSGGFSVQGTQPPQPDGQASVSTTAQPTTTTRTSLAAHGVVLALAVPKLTVSIGTDSFMAAVKQFLPTQVFGSAEANASGLLTKLFKKPAKTDFFKIEAGAYVQNVLEFDYTGSGPLSVVPCSLTHITNYLQSGADATLFGLKASGQDPHVELGKKTQVVRNPDIPACGQK